MNELLIKLEELTKMIKEAEENKNKIEETKNSISALNKEMADRQKMDKKITVKVNSEKIKLIQDLTKRKAELKNIIDETNDLQLDIDHIPEIKDKMSLGDSHICYSTAHNFRVIRRKLKNEYAVVSNTLNVLKMTDDTSKVINSFNHEKNKMDNLTKNKMYKGRVVQIRDRKIKDIQEDVNKKIEEYKTYLSGGNNSEKIC